MLPAPIVTAIHAGLLANDVVGFHTERWRSAFLSACSSLGLDTGDALVTAHPISIDPDEFDEPGGERRRCSRGSASWSRLGPRR